MALSPAMNDPITSATLFAAFRGISRPSVDRKTRPAKSGRRMSASSTTATPPNNKSTASTLPTS